MRQFLVMTLICFFSSCSSRTDTEEAHELARWNGKPVQKLREHSYFKNLPQKTSEQEDGSKTIIFTNQTKFQSNAYCQSLGGCIGLPAFNCQHIVKYRNDLITGIEQLGTCPGPSTTSP